MKYRLGIDCFLRKFEPNVYAWQLKEKFDLKDLDVDNPNSKGRTWIWEFEDAREDLKEGLHEYLTNLYERDYIRGSIVSDYLEQLDNTPKEDQRVVDFVNGLNQLCKNTGIKLFSSNWSASTAIQIENDVYILEPVTNLIRNENDIVVGVEHDFKATQIDRAIHRKL